MPVRDSEVVTIPVKEIWCFFYIEFYFLVIYIKTNLLKINFKFPRVLYSNREFRMTENYIKTLQNKINNIKLNIKCYQ